MAQITLNIPDDKEQRFLDAFADVFKWSQDLPETKKQFMKSKLKAYMREILFRAESYASETLAKQTLQADIDSIEVN